MKKLISYLSILLIIAMLFSACADTAGDGTSGASDTETESATAGGTSAETGENTQTDAPSDTEGNTEGNTDADTEGNSDADTEGDTEADTDADTSTDTEADTEISLEGPFADSIEYAHEIANGVQAYYPNGAERDSFTVENQNMTANFGLYQNDNAKLNYLANKQGASYVEDTMDVFIRMTDGSTYYASGSDVNARMNIYRIGYYYYDVRLLSQSFFASAKVEKELDVDESEFKPAGSLNVSSFEYADGVIKYTACGIDPYVTSGELSAPLDEYDAVTLSVKTSSATSLQLFVKTETQGYNNGRTKSIEIIPDGEWHTYRIMFDEVPEIEGVVTGVRFDAGYFIGEQVEIKDVKLQALDSSAPYVYLDRTLHTYSDKLHQELRFVAPRGQDNIDAVGMVTNISKDRVAKLIVKDASGLRETLDGVDWDSVEYVGFDITDAGIFGYVMPCDDKSGSIRVELDGDVYKITQELSPNGGRIDASLDARYTEHDLSMGQRIYTDDTHSFDRFIKEAEWERDPMTSIKSDGYLGYDAIRGAYHFKIGGTSFNTAYYFAWNLHFSTEATIKNLGEERKLYIRTLTTAEGLENAVLLDEGGLVLPIPLEVSKNFGGEAEEYLMNHGDEPYGETLFPIVSAANSQITFNVINAYQNWGLFPIRQLSSIGYYAPYYHLSSGVTETSCISPWYVRGRTAWTLPDFRALSAPMWEGQPQHTSTNVPQILHYYDADGNLILGENVQNTVLSYGPVYAEVEMDYVTDDGKLAITYNHLEMPQTDELRACYEVKINVLEDISFENFKRDFVFYKFLPSGLPQKMCYIDESNEVAYALIKPEDKRSEFVLGTDAPFFGTFDIENHDGTPSDTAVNIGFLIHSSDITVGGEKFDGNFIVIEEVDRDYCLSLDLEEVTFKAGDRINFNIIITPWSSYPDVDADNLIEMRDNSILDPYKLTAIDGEVIESTYLPRFRSTNGKSAEFTISGGANNAAIRVYGFDKLTAPKIYELIDGEWIPYEVSSINAPDNVGSKNYYDGYYTYYDGDGTYSYAFAVNMDEADSRTFRITADHDFEPWPEVEKENNDPINLYFDPMELQAMLSTGTPGIGSVTLSDEADYVRITGDSATEKSEVTVTLYNATEKLATGQYIVMKYRLPAANAERNHFEFFTSTVNDSAKGSDAIDLLPGDAHIHDDEWHIIVVDASKYRDDTFLADEDGCYYGKYIRFDIFNTNMSSDSYVDVAYVGMCDSLDTIREINSDESSATYAETLTLFVSGGYSVIDVQTGKTLSVKGDINSQGSDNGVTMSTNTDGFVAEDNDRGYTVSSVAYIARIDSINGYGPNLGTGVAYNNCGSNSKDGIATFRYNGSSTGDMALVIAGWSLFHGGVDKYVWSADGGKTWNDATLYNRTSLGSASDGMVNIANSETGKTDFDLYVANSSYQGSVSGPASASGVAADLSAFKDQTVDVIFAAVPASEPNTVCIMAKITGVAVAEKSAEEDENPYGDPINFLLDAEEIYAQYKDGVAGTSSVTLSDDSDYVRFTGDGAASEAFLNNVYSTDKNIATGQYVAVKLRFNPDSSTRDYLNLYTSTVNATVNGNDDVTYFLTDEYDGEWHVLVFDVSSYLPESFVAKGEKYFAKYLRFDFFNKVVSSDYYADIAYVGFSDSIEDLCALNSDMDTLKLISSGKTQTVDVKTGEIADN